MPDAPTPEMLKRMKVDMVVPGVEPANGNGTHEKMDVDKGKGKSKATVEDVEDEDDIDRDFAPGNDADYFAEEDEEGRFFGGGLTKEQKEILSIFESATDQGVERDVSTSFFLFRVLNNV